MHVREGNILIGYLYNIVQIVIYVLLFMHILLLYLFVLIHTRLVPGIKLNQHRQDVILPSNKIKKKPGNCSGYFRINNLIYR